MAEEIWLEFSVSVLECTGHFMSCAVDLGFGSSFLAEVEAVSGWV